MNTEEKPLRISIHVLTGAERQNWINPELAGSLISLTTQPREGTRLGVQFVSDLRPTGFARNHSCECGIRSNADWVAMVDNDQTLPRDLLGLVKEADGTPGVDIISCCTWMWSPRLNCPVVNSFEDQSRTERLVLEDKPGFQEVYAAGGGVLLLRASILERIPRPWFWDQFDSQTGQCLVGEDLNFCLKARAAGLSVHTHSGFKSGHLKTTNFRNYAEAIACKLTDLYSELRNANEHQENK